MSIAIVLASYNGERFIRDQLTSIAGQTRLPDEMVVVDDCSSDATVDIVREFYSNAEFPVRLVLNDINLGSTQSFARAIELSQADIIVTCDQDDVWHGEKLSKIEKAFADSPDAGLAVCNARAMDEEGNPVGADLFALHGFDMRRRGMVRKGEALLVFLRTAPSGNAMAFHSRLKDMVLPIPKEWSHDIWISLIAATVSEVIVVPDCLTMYRQHSGNQIGLVQLSLRNRVRESKLHGIEFYKDEVSRYEDLRGRVEEAVPDIDEDVLLLINEKIGHMNVRAGLSRSRIRRILPVLSEVVAGNYARYSGNGLVSALRDVVF